ncbi:geranylgeranyl diphosphate synthase, type II [Alkalibacterium subtropicum]|uniref:Farnesyl diphosphate synthase n=1 Tax=Alkalibacterium subtropicum TaxID=753702 RepID=A0A1I1GQN2_9LACT|nr:farnesyl diphosphate synthase [Alkalibacterium subtropicum]SFC13775.1 geranylgeranyl diphosphate synthase, type II [Alkalibacterium subtropicum]
MQFQTFTEAYKESFENYLTDLIQNKSQTAIEEAMRYSLEAGGKRLRPLILLALVRAFDQDYTQALPAAAALEMIHTYSLIHDDLPAMDDDDLRRGKPTSHIKYTEATAILAGDALLTKAFEILTQGNLADKVKLSLIRELAQASGHEGMVGGQQADMDGENKDLSVEELASIHSRKTGMLIRFAFRAAGLLTERDEVTLTDLDTIADKVGVAYQIRDDILDVTSTEEEIGKRVGADAKHGKSTYPALLGLEGAQARFDEHLDDALELNEAIKRRHSDYDKELLASFILSLKLK